MKLQDKPLDWSFSVIGIIEDARYLETPKTQYRVNSEGEVENIDEYSVTISPLQQHWRETYEVSEKLDKALRYIESPYDEAGVTPRLDVFDKHDHIILRSLFPISLRGESCDRYESRKCQASFSLYNYRDGLIVANPRVVDVKPLGYFPDLE